jgi:DnaK suppressor protein
MDEQQLKQFEEQLLKLQTELMGVADLIEDASQTVALDQTAVGRVSRIDALQMQEMALASQDRQNSQLIKIKAALARLEDGDYGYCLKCDELISIGRLEIDPAIEYCVNCAD